MKINSAVNVKQTGVNYHITICFDQKYDDALMISYINDLKEYVKKNNIIFIYQKIFKICETAAVSVIENNLCWDQQTFAPITFTLFYEELYETPIIGVHLFGVNKRQMSAIELVKNSDSSFVHYNSQGIDYLYGYHKFSCPKDGFRQLQSILDEMNCSVSNIVRTWFYLNNILTEYPSFNQARNQFFKQNEISFATDSKDLPASTCIGGKTHCDNSAMMLVAMHSKDKFFSKQRIYNNMQNEAEGNDYLYQPAFSRAMMVSNGAEYELQISGTASVGKDGKTEFEGNSYKQIGLTLKNITNILDSVGMQISDIVESNVFVKSKEYYDIFLDICGQLKIEFPHVCVIGDVCRGDLLFEIDGIARKIMKG